MNSLKDNFTNRSQILCIPLMWPFHISILFTLRLFTNDVDELMLFVSVQNKSHKCVIHLDVSKKRPQCISN